MTVVEVQDPDDTWREIRASGRRPWVVEQGTSDTGTPAPTATIKSDSREDVSAGQNLRVRDGNTMVFEGRITDAPIQGDGNRPVSAEHEGYRLLEEQVTLSVSGTDEDVFQAAVNNSSRSGEFTVSYSGTATTLGDTYDVDNRSIRRVFSDMADRTGRIFWIDGPNDTVRVQPYGGAGSISDVDTSDETYAARLEEFNNSDLKSVTNEATVIGTGGEKVEGFAENLTSKSDYGRQPERVQVSYVTSQSEADAYASELLVPDPLPSAEVTVGSRHPANIETPLVNQSVRIVDNANGVDVTVPIEQQTITPGQATITAGEGAAVNVERFNRNQKSKEDTTEPGSVYNTDRIADDAVEEEKLVDLSVTEQKLKDLAVATDKLQNNAVINGKLEDFAVDTSKLEAAAVATAKLEDNAVVNGKLSNLSVGSGELQDAAVATAKLEDNAVINGKLSDLSVSKTKIQDDSIATPKLQANAVTASEVKADTITASEIAAGTITALEILADTITADEINASTITAAEIAANTITAGEIAADTITASEVLAGTITALEIDADTITASEIAAGTISATEIEANAITAGEIDADTITAAEIAAGTITATEILSDTITAGEIDAGTITALEIAAGTLTANEINTLYLNSSTIRVGTETNTDIRFTEVDGDTAMVPDTDGAAQVGDDFDRFSNMFMVNLDTEALFAETGLLGESSDDRIELKEVSGETHLSPDTDDTCQLGDSSEAYKEMWAHDYINAVTGNSIVDGGDPLKGLAAEPRPPDHCRVCDDDGNEVGTSLNKLSEELWSICTAQQRVISDLEGRVEDLEERLSKLEAQNE